MPLITKPNYNQIFASQAPEQDKPAVFNNYPGGWGVESRPNNGKPTIKGFNYLQQTSDLKDLWILQNGACLPYDESIEYAEGAPVLKDGVIQYKTAGGFKSRDAVSIPTYNNAADGIDPITGVADGAYFNVRSSSDESYIDEYQNVGGVPAPSGKSYPSNMAKWDASGVVDASGKNQQEINDEYARRFETVADPRNFGSKNNGVDDDAAAVREAVSYLESIGGGTLFLDSMIPWKFASLSSNNSDAVVLNTSNIKIDFGSQLSSIVAATEMRAMFKLSDNYKNNIDIIGGQINGMNLAEYGLYGDPSTYNPFMQIMGFEARGFTKAAASMNPYMTVIQRSNFSFSPKGLVLNNKSASAEITSTTLIGVYANGCTEKGFEINNTLTYSNMISCGVDSCGGIAYDLSMQSANMLGCGAERVLQLARFNLNDGVQINGLVGISVGSLDSVAPIPAAVEVLGAGIGGIDLSGVRLLTVPSETRYYDKKLKVVSTSGVYPRVRIHDRNIRKSETVTEGVSTYKYPIEFLEAEIRADGSETITPSALKDRLSNLNGLRIDFNHTIQLSNGTESLDKLIEDIKGVGTLTIQGNAADRTLVKIKGARLGLILKNCECHIVFKNLTIEFQTGYGDNTLADLDAENCRLITLDNVFFNSPDGFSAGAAVRAKKGTSVKLINGTTTGNLHKLGEVYQAQTGSSIELEPMAAPPSAGRWTYGMRVKNTSIGATGLVEWIYLLKGDSSGVEWRPVTI